MIHSTRRIFLIALFSLMSFCISPFAGLAGEAASLTPETMPRISIDELKAMLGSPELVVIDVRKEKDWTAADRKIPGAFREDWQAAEQWALKYPLEKTIVLYCT